jgi:septum formation topological specificity factor MinE
MHITYETKLVERNAINKNAQESLKTATTRKERLEIVTREVRERIDSLTAEQDEIVNTCAKFAQFTKKNAILAYNDDIDMFLDLLINEERNKQAQFNADPYLVDSRVLDGLVRTKLKYSEQKRIFEQSAARGESARQVNAEDVDKLAQELCRLQINGPTLKRIIDHVHENKSSVVRFSENRHQVTKRDTTSGHKAFKVYF